MTPNGRSVATNTARSFSIPNGDEVDGDVVLVRHPHRHLAHVGAGGEQRLAHGVERVLHRLRVVGRERLEQRLTGSRADVVVRRGAGVEVGPIGGDLGRQDAVLGLGQHGELVAQEPGERRVGRLQHGEPGDPAPHAERAVAVCCHDRRRCGGRSGGERVRVRCAADLGARPGVLAQGHLGHLGGRRGVQVAPGQRGAEVLDRAGEVLLGECIDRRAHRVGRQDRGVVALGVHRVEVTLQTHVDGQVAQLVQLVTRTPATDQYEPDAVLAVAVGPHRRGHRRLASPRQLPR